MAEEKKEQAKEAKEVNEVKEEKNNAEQVAIPAAETPEVKEIEKVAVAVPVAPTAVQEEVIQVKFPSSLEKWIPRTSLGKKVFSGEIADINTVLDSGVPIREPEIVDKLMPEIKNEIVLIGGRTGKGGGVQRIPVKITAKMHRSGRRLATSAFVVVGNENGIVGIGKGNAIEARNAIAKAIQRAKMNIIRVSRGCGSWECRCGTEHSVAFKTRGKGGSVRVELLPAPKGVGLVADDETKKILRLAGIRDVWVKTFGNTSARINLITAVFDALKKLYVYEKAAAGVARGKVAEETSEEEEKMEEETEEGEEVDEGEAVEEEEYEDEEIEEEVVAEESEEEVEETNGEVDEKVRREVSRKVVEKEV